MSGAKPEHYHAFIAEIEALEQKAHRVFLPDVAQHLNRAKNAVGWALADFLEDEQATTERNK